MQSTIFCSVAGDGGIYPQKAETIRYVAIVKRKVLVFFSQSTQLKPAEIQ